MTAVENVGVFIRQKVWLENSYFSMEQTVCSETPAYKIQTSGNYPEESIQQFISFVRLKMGPI
jgi:hypothetical protein